MSRNELRMLAADFRRNEQRVRVDTEHGYMLGEIISDSLKELWLVADGVGDVLIPWDAISRIAESD